MRSLEHFFALSAAKQSGVRVFCDFSRAQVQGALADIATTTPNQGPRDAHSSQGPFGGCAVGHAASLMAKRRMRIT